MDINEQIKAAEAMVKYTQDYIGVKKLLKTIKTDDAKKELQATATSLASNIEILLKEIL